MTINIALVTNEALILGCDSVASASGYFVNPWPYVERSEDGKIQLDESGRMVARFDWGAISPVVTDVWGGVAKMFEVCRRSAKVAATTSGLAQLSGRNMSSYAVQFFRSTQRGKGYSTVKEVAHAFLVFMAEQYEAHYAKVETPQEFRDELNFIVGGYGSEDHFPSLYRVAVKKGAAENVYENGAPGLAWAGQADGVERLLFGVEGRLQFRVEQAIENALKAYSKEASDAIVRILSEVLARVEKDLPQGVDTNLPPVPQVKLPWMEFRLDIDFANIPLQDGIELVSYLVNLQSGRAKFVRGLATVGGRTHIGIMRRTGSFEMLNEPTLQHRNVGFAHDL